MCVCLKAPNLTYIVGSLILNSQQHYNSYTVGSLILNGQQHYNACLDKAYLTQYFLHKAYHSFLVLRNTRQHFCTMLGSHVKQQNEQNAQKCKNMALNRPWKGHLFTVWAETRRQSIILHNLSEDVHFGWLKIFSALCMQMSVNDLQNLHSYWSWGYK